MEEAVPRQSEAELFSPDPCSEAQRSPTCFEGLNQSGISPSIPGAVSPNLETFPRLNQGKERNSGSPEEPVLEGWTCAT